MSEFIETPTLDWATDTIDYRIGQEATKVAFNAYQLGYQAGLREREARQ